MMAADPRSDAQLLADARREPAAFGVLYDRQPGRRRPGPPPPRHPSRHLDERSYERIEELADLRELRGALEAALASLPAAQAAAIRLRVLHELSYADVAGRLGCSEGAARVRVCRGLDQLARLLPHPHQETTT